MTEPETATARIVRALAEDIVAGHLLPGERLEEQALATRYLASRTPVREALRDLAARGLVTLGARRGAEVARISAEDVADLLDAECELEGLCARLAAQRMTAVEKQALAALHEQMEAVVAAQDLPAYLGLNAEFHGAICDGARNRTIAEATRSLRARLSPLRQAQDEGVVRLSKAHAEHAAILAAILRADAAAAFDAMRSHNARLATNVVRRLRAAPPAARLRA